jgi:hypothetical protein
MGLTLYHSGRPYPRPTGSGQQWSKWPMARQTTHSGRLVGELGCYKLSLSPSTRQIAAPLINTVTGVTYFMKSTPSRWPIVLGLVLATLGILVPIAWDLIKTKSALQLVYLGETTLVSKSEGLNKLRLIYEGKELRSITAMRFSLANNGRRPITGSDLIEPPEVRLTGNVEILDFINEGAFPKNLTVSLERASSSSIRIVFPLLNPGDNVNFSLLVADSPNQAFEAAARIVGIDELRVERRSSVAATAKGGRPWMKWVVGGFAFLSLFSAVSGATDIPSELRCKRRIRSKTPLITSGSSKEAAGGAVFQHLSWTTSQERRAIRRYLEKLPDGQSLNEENISEISLLIEAAASEATSNITMAIVAFTIGTFGALYALGVF